MKYLPFLILYSYKIHVVFATILLVENLVFIAIDSIFWNVSVYFVRTWSRHAVSEFPPQKDLLLSLTTKCRVCVVFYELVIYVVLCNSFLYCSISGNLQLKICVTFNSAVTLHFFSHSQKEEYSDLELRVVPAFSRVLSVSHCRTIITHGICEGKVSFKNRMCHDTDSQGNE